MDYKTEIEFFDTLDDDDKAKEIYAHFGRAVYFAQVLEQQAIIMIVFCRRSKHNLETQEQLQNLWDDYDLGSRTFGLLINEIKQLYNLTADDFKELKEVLKLRNYITHNYFRFNTELFYSESGKKRMLKDFIEFCDKAKALDDKLFQYLKVYTEKIGLTEEVLGTIVEQTKQKWQEKIIANDHKTFIK